MKKNTFRAMGSQILIALDTTDTAINELAVEARNWFEDWEQIFSRFRLTSELSELNQQSGFPVNVSETMWKVLELAVQNENLTGGLVTPLILNALEFAGYTSSFNDMNTSLEGISQQPDPYPQAIDARIILDRDNHQVSFPSGAKIDLGGVVKGWAAHETMLKLKHLAPVLVDAGGDIAISGPRLEGGLWAVGVSDPFSSEQDIDLLMLSGGGVATSGRDYRRWRKGDVWQHHIIDPRTASSAETDIVTATVISDNVMKAEAISKASLILGSQNAIPWLNALPETEYLLILEEGKIIKSAGLTNQQWNAL